MYAFVSSGSPDEVTLIAKFIPLQLPASGRNFWELDDNVLHEMVVDNNADAEEDVTFQFRFRSETPNPNTFLYVTGVVTTLDDPDLNVRQFSSVTRIEGPRRTGRADGRLRLAVSMAIGTSIAPGTARAVAAGLACDPVLLIAQPAAVPAGR